MELTFKEKKYLLCTAREALRSLFVELSSEKVDYNIYPGLNISSGAFVTLKKKGQLRGCVGFIQSETMLVDTIHEAAINAAVNDTRFFPVSFNEVDKIEIEISVLSKPVKMENYEDITIGKHGLILQEAGGRALLLPQVPVEHKLNRDQFLSALCEKAGLYGDFWKIKPLNIYLFTADVFSEKMIRELEDANS